DASVLLPGLLVVARVFGTELAIALGAEAVAWHAARDERRHDAVHAVLREPEVVGVARALVGVAGDLDERELGVVDDGGRHRVEDLVRLGEDLRRGRLELDLLEDDDVLVLDDDVALVGTAVLVLVAVVGLRLVRTLVDDVGDLILVVVRIGATVGVLEPVLVFGIVGQR